MNRNQIFVWLFCIMVFVYFSGALGYKFIISPEKAQATSQFPPDLNGDSYISFADIQVVLNNWNTGAGDYAIDPNTCEHAYREHKMYDATYLIYQKAKGLREYLQYNDDPNTIKATLDEIICISGWSHLMKFAPCPCDIYHNVVDANSVDPNS